MSKAFHTTEKDKELISVPRGWFVRLLEIAENIDDDYAGDKNYLLGYIESVKLILRDGKETKQKN